MSGRQRRAPAVLNPNTAQQTPPRLASLFTLITTLAALAVLACGLLGAFWLATSAQVDGLSAGVRTPALQASMTALPAPDARSSNE